MTKVDVDNAEEARGEKQDWTSIHDWLRTLGREGSRYRQQDERSDVSAEATDGLQNLSLLFDTVSEVGKFPSASLYCWTLLRHLTLFVL